MKRTTLDKLSFLLIVFILVRFICLCSFTGILFLPSQMHAFISVNIYVSAYSFIVCVYMYMYVLVWVYEHMRLYVCRLCMGIYASAHT